MTKKNRTLLIMLCVFVALSALLYGVYQWLNRDGEPEGENEVKTVSVFSADESDLLKMEIFLSDSSFSFVRTEEGWQIAGKPNFLLSQLKAQNLCYALTDIEAEELIGENITELEPFGLTEPETTVSLSFKDGESKRFVIGNQVLAGSSYYFAEEGSGTVYLIPNGTATTFSRPVSYYHEDRLFEIDARAILGVSVMQNGFLSYEIAYNPEDGTATMVGPYQKAVDMEQYGTLVLEALDKNLEIVDIVDTDGELSEYGLLNPAYEVGITTADGVTYSFLLGKEEGEMRYAKLRDSEAVFTVLAEAFSFVKQPPKVFLDPYVKTYTLTEVDRIEVTQPSGKKVMEILREGESEKFMIDGKEVEDAKFREAYRYLIGIYAEDFDVPPVISGSPDFTIRYVFNNGDADSLVEYYPLDARRYRAKVDGAWTPDVVLASTLEQALDVLNQY